MQRLMARLIEHNISQLDYVRDYHNPESVVIKAETSPVSCLA
nr:carboxysome shell carbonic anhydrase domain-containg protein [Thermochromatium tepidum]